MLVRSGSHLLRAAWLGVPIAPTRSSSSRSRAARRTRCRSRSCRSAGSPPARRPSTSPQVVAADLQRSGRFAPLDRKDMIDRPTAGDQIRFQDWRYLKSDFIVVGKLDAGRRRSLRGAVRAVQRAHRPAPHRAAADGDDELACARMSHRIADIIFEQLTGHSRRVLDAHRLRQRRRHAAAAALQADRGGRRRREPADDRQLDASRSCRRPGRRTARASRTCRSRARRPPSTCRRCAPASGGACSARAGINGAPAWSPDGGTLALTLSRKDGDVDVYTLKLSSQTLTRMTLRSGHRHRAGVVGRRPQAVLHVGSRRRPADLRDRRRPAESCDARDVRRQLQRPAAPVARRQAAGRRASGSRQLSHRHRRSARRRGVQVLSQGRQDESPSFAPNGATLIYATQDRGRGVLATVSVDGRVQQRLAASTRRRARAGVVAVPARADSSLHSGYRSRT